MSQQARFTRLSPFTVSPTALFASLLVGLLGCSALPPPPIGQLQLGLSSGIGDAQYRLSGASFAIDGAAQVSLNSEDAPASDSLQRALPAGSYSVQLLDGWHLERAGSLAGQVVAAELVSKNPLEFAIAPGELTRLTFQFRTLGDDARVSGDGQVRIAIEVDGASSPQVIFSELMKNPEILPDASGEWIELYNAGAEPIELGGCTLARDEQTLTLDGDFPIEAGGFLTLANGEAPGFSANVLYHGVTLPNTGAFVLRLSCGEQVLDEVEVDPAKLTNRAGHSLALSGSAMDGRSSAAPSDWCDGTPSYNGDFGTPGSDNPDCAA